MADRIGLTMRVSQAPGCGEARDCLAQDWGPFLADALPGARWMPVPNLGRAVLDFVRAWQLDGFILTGGNDLDESPLRDETERALLEFALGKRAPVFGVCRGLQLIQRHFGGGLQPCDAGAHAGARHDVTVEAASAGGDAPPQVREVNSFHHWAARLGEVPAPLRVFASSHDGWAEGIVHRTAPVLAVQWHPERMRPYHEHDRTLVRRTFQRAA